MKQTDGTSHGIDGEQLDYYLPAMPSERLVGAFRRFVEGLNQQDPTKA